MSDRARFVAYAVGAAVALAVFVTLGALTWRRAGGFDEHIPGWLIIALCVVAVALRGLRPRRGQIDGVTIAQILVVFGWVPLLALRIFATRSTFNLVVGGILLVLFAYWTARGIAGTRRVGWGGSRAAPDSSAA